MHSNHHPSQFEEYLTNGKEFRQSKTRYQKLSSSSIQIMQKIKAERSKLYCRSTQDNSPVNSHLQRQFQLAIRVRDDDTLWRMAIQRLTITYPVPCQHCWKTLFTKVHQEDIDSASSAAAHNSNALSMIPPIVHCQSCRSAPVPPYGSLLSILSIRMEECSVICDCFDSSTKSPPPYDIVRLVTLHMSR